jgi:hypothetical protein
MPTVDADGFIYVVGSTSSTDLPVTGDALQRKSGGGEDGAVVVLSPDGSRVLYATYLGGSGDEIVRSLALGPGGDVYLIGSTSSEDFPVTPGALQDRHRGAGDAFVVKLEGLPRFPEGEWVSLFDGKTMFGKVVAADGSIVLEAGGPMTGIAWTGNVPRGEYEVALEGQRIEGGDFFCGLTVPVGNQHVTLILGGWGGNVVGLSNIDSYSAVENETTAGKEFENGRWYAIGVRVTATKIETWIDDDQVIDFDRTGHQFTIWPQQEPGKPLGITSYYTKAAFRNIRVRALRADR